MSIFRSGPGRLLSVILAAGIFLIPGACGKKAAVETVPLVVSQAEFDQILEKSGNQLIAFDLMADWCMPCKILAPRLENVARAEPRRIKIYRVDIERMRGIAQRYNVSSIPQVIFFRNRQVVGELMGLHPEQTYLDAIERFSS